MNLCNLTRWEHGSWDLTLHKGSPILHPKYDTNAYIDNNFWRWSSRLLLRVGLSKKLDLIHNTSLEEASCIKWSRSYFHGYKPYFNKLLRLEGWDFASMLGLIDMSGTWVLGPMWTYLQEVSPKKSPTNPTNNIHTCHVRFHVGFFIHSKCYGLSQTTLI